MNLYSVEKSTLDLGKQHMYRFFPDVVKPKYGDNFKMANTGTDSFVFRTRTDDIYIYISGIETDK